GEGAGVAHEDLRGRGVPPQDADAGADDRRAQHRGVQRIAGAVAVDEAAGVEVDVAHLTPLPEADDEVRGGEDDRRAGGEAVEPVGEVHPVGPGGDQEVRPDREEDDAAGGAEEGEVQPGDVPHEGDVRGGRGDAEVVGEHQREDREGGRDDELAQQLVAGAQPGAVLLGDLQVVIEEAHDPEPHGEEQHQHHRDAGARPQHQVREEVADEDREDDRDAAHGGGAALGGVGGGAVVADELAVAAPLEHLDEQRGAEDGEQERDGSGDDDRDHWICPVRAASARCSSCSTRGPATPRSPASREDFMRTTSPGRRVLASTSIASSTVSRCSDSPPKLPSRLAPWWIAAAPSPTEYSCEMFSRTARRLISSCSRTESGPSSSISPSTATVRWVRPRWARVLSAWRIESGFAL